MPEPPADLLRASGNCHASMLIHVGRKASDDSFWAWVRMVGKPFLSDTVAY